MIQDWPLAAPRQTESGQPPILEAWTDTVVAPSFPIGMFALESIVLRQSLCLIGGLCLAVLLGGCPGQAAYGQQDPDEGAVADTGRTPSPPAAPPDSVTADDVGPGPTDQAIVKADSLSALERDGEQLQELFDNVRVRQDSTRIRSAFALRYLDRDQLLFTGDVVMYERGDTLWADTVRYNKRTKVGHARSNVRLTDGKVMVRAPRATYYTKEKRSVFPDSVTLVDSTRVLRAQSGTYWSNDRRAQFRGNVRLTDPETHIVSDSLTYYRDRERSIAHGHVSIRRTGRNADAPTDTTTRTYLFGEWADNQEQNRFSRVEGHALLVRVRMDSTGAPEDTLVVRGRRLDAFRTDSRRRLIAVDSVRIWENDLSAVADSAAYDRIVATDTSDTLATPNPLPGPHAPRPPSASAPPADADTIAVPPSDSATAVADTTQVGPTAPQDSTAGRADPGIAQQEPPVDSVASDTVTADSARTSEAHEGQHQSPWTGLSGDSAQQLPLEETRLFQDPVTWMEESQIWGDSIRVRARERTPDTVFVRSAAFATQRDEALDRIQQLKGRTLTAFFQADSLRRIEATPNARAIRFLKTEQGTLKGAARTSGDLIVLHFRDGTVRRTSIIGGVESTYYRTPKAVPTPFRLDGFQWTPERRPTKEGLLREPRVRRRLDLSTEKPSRVAARTPSDSTSVPPDSTMRRPAGREGRPPAIPELGRPLGRGMLPTIPDSSSLPSRPVLPHDSIPSSPPTP